MAKFIVNGPSKLSGSVEPVGNKNAVLKLIPASLLFKGDYKLTNVPAISDVDSAIEVLAAMGANINYDKSAGNLTINTDAVSTADVPIDLAKKYRASVSFIGPLLGRFSRVKSIFPGGDKIGPRELTAHFASLAQLGAVVKGNTWGEFELDGQLKSGEVFLYEPSVTATENVIMTAVVVPGKTRIVGAACEPHVQELCQLLKDSGASIEGIGSNVIEINGSSSLLTQVSDHRVWPDFLDVGAFIAAAAVTNSELTIKNVRPQDLITIEFFYNQLGVKFEYISAGESTDLLIRAGQTMSVSDPIWGRTKGVYSQPWYGFPTDLMSITIAMAMQCTGSTLFFEKLYPDRLAFVSYFNAAGANIIICDPHRIVVNGPTKLKGFNYVSPDIRAGMSYLIAALSSEGKSEIAGAEHIDRAYPNTAERFKALGVDITRID